jgi:DNA-binding response OmpR family regulator
VAGTIFVVDPAGWGASAVSELRGAGFVVMSVSGRVQAERLMRRRPPDHVILVDSPRCRDAAASVQEMMDVVGTELTLVADGRDPERMLEALEAGATDVVPLDCPPHLLLARVRAILRRTGGLPVDIDAPITNGELTLYPDERRVCVRGREIRLTPIECALLHTLMRDPGVVYAREDLLDAIWGTRGPALERTIDAHIWKLRRKIEPEAGHPRYIFSVQGLGYRFRRPEAPEHQHIEARAG